MKFEHLDLLEPTEANLADVEFVGASDSAPFAFEYAENFEAKQGVAGLSNLRIADVSKQLPEGVGRDDLRSGFGNWDYCNRVTSQIDGYAIDEAGVPSEGFFWVLMEADITNGDRVIAEINGSGSHFGSFMVADSEDAVSWVRSRSFAFTEGNPDMVDEELGYRLLVAPGETKTLRWLTVLPDIVLDDPSAFFWVGAEGGGHGIKLDALRAG